MTVQELIDALQQIEDKSRKILVHARVTGKTCIGLDRLVVLQDSFTKKNMPELVAEYVQFKDLT